MPQSTLGSLRVIDSLPTVGGLSGINTANGLTSGGVMPMNTLRLLANVADTETVTIGNDVYEFDSNNSFTTGRIPVIVSAGLTPAIAGPALAAAINANPQSRVNAVSLGSGARVVVFPRRTSDYSLTTFTFAETLAGAGNAWDSTTTFSGGLIAPQWFEVASRVPNASEVTAGFMDFLFPFVPTRYIIQIVTTATGAILAWDGVATLDATTRRIQLDNSGVTDWAATHTVRVFAWG